MPLLAPLGQTVDSFVAQFDEIPEDRRRSLERLAAFMRKRIAASEPIRLTFVCTHNSRRSQMAQIWSAVGASRYGVDGVAVYSGGTEATSFNPSAVAAMERAGFEVHNPGGSNPHYLVRYSLTESPIESFSKTYDDAFNPQEDFVAVMTCSEADEACPVVPGASLRVLIAYEDPKESDGTPEEPTVYDRRCAQIGTEMLYVFSRA